MLGQGCNPGGNQHPTEPPMWSKCVPWSSINWTGHVIGVDDVITQTKLLIPTTSIIDTGRNIYEIP